MNRPDASALLAMQEAEEELNEKRMDKAPNQLEWESIDKQLVDLILLDERTPEQEKEIDRLSDILEHFDDKKTNYS